MKNYCSVHHYYYSGGMCPICASEKYEKLVEKSKKESKVIKKEDVKASIVTDEMLSKLKKKFSK